MRIRYDFIVSEPVSLKDEFIQYFGKKEVGYGAYQFRFKADQIHHERQIQAMLAQYPQIQGKLCMEDLGVMADAY